MDLIRSREVHPSHAGYRLARRLRWLRRVRGWRRLAARLAPPGQSAAFRVSNDGIVYDGEIASFLDRELYLFGQYEREQIDIFLALVQPDRRRVLLDIGANIGTHSLYFAKHFQTIHSFEPNPDVCRKFHRNVSMNDRTNIFLHEVGLGAVDAVQPFYSIDKNNSGLGTFLNVEQYDLPLRQIATLQVENGDKYIETLRLENVDAIKIDVQGYEPDVISGLSQTLARFRPVVWFEYSAGTGDRLKDMSAIKGLFPYPVYFWRLSGKRSLLLNSVRRERADDDLTSQSGDFIAVPIR